MSQIQHSPMQVTFKQAEGSSNVSDRLRTRKSIHPSTNKSTNSSKSSTHCETTDDDSVFSIRSVSKPSMERTENSNSMLKYLEMADGRRRKSSSSGHSRRSNVANSTRRPSMPDVAGIDSFCPDKIVASIRKSSTGRRMSFDGTNEYDSMVSDISEMSTLPTMMTNRRPDDRFVVMKRGCGCREEVTTVVTEKIIRTTPRETTTYFKKTEKKQRKD